MSIDTSVTGHIIRYTSCRGHLFVCCSCGKQFGKVSTVEQGAARHSQHTLEALADRFATR